MQSVPRNETGRRVVVVGVDFSGASDYALRSAVDQVRPSGAKAELHILHVTNPAPYWPVMRGELPPSVPTEQENLDRLHRHLLDACFATGRDTQASVTPHVTVGDPASAIVELAREVGADLIVLGAHRRSGLAGAFHRSLHARVVRKAPCSVMAAQPKELPPEATIEPPCDDCMRLRRQSGGVVMWCGKHAEHHVHGHVHYASNDPFGNESWTFRT